MNDVRVTRVLHRKSNTPRSAESKSFVERSAKYSNMAYLPEENIRNRLTSEGATKIFIYSYEGMLAFMAELEHDIVVSFRGVDTAAEFKTIMKFWKRDQCGVQVHSGFAESVDKFSRFIIHDINVMSKNKKILYTGHSFGGAMALLLTLNHKPDIICTFGAPKAGGGIGFTKLFEGIEVHRVQTKSDFVTLLPPSIPMLMEYDHVGDLVQLDGIVHPYETHRMRIYTKAVIRKERNVT